MAAFATLWAVPEASAQEAFWETSNADVDAWRLAVQATIDSRSRTFPFGLSISALYTPHFLAARSGNVDIRTGLGLRLRSPSHGTPSAIGAHMWAVGPLLLAELGSRVGLRVTDDWDFYLRGAVRAGADATRVDADQLPAEIKEPRAVTASVVGTHLALGTRIYFMQLGLELDDYLVLGQSEVSQHRDQLMRGPALGLFLIARAMADVSFFVRVVAVGEDDTLRAVGWTAGVAGSLVP